MISFLGPFLIVIAWQLLLELLLGLLLELLLSQSKMSVLFFVAVFLPNLKVESSSSLSSSSEYELDFSYADDDFDFIACTEVGL